MSSDNIAFKKIQYFSKTNPQKLFNILSDFNIRYSKLSNLYFNDVDVLDSLNYGTFRQHNYISSKSLNNNFLSKIDSKNINKFLNYNYNINYNSKSSVNDLSNIKLHNRNSKNNFLKVNEMVNTLNLSKNKLYTQFLNYPTKTSLLNSENDAKQYNNTIKYNLNLKFNKKNFLGKDYINSFTDNSDISSNLFLDNLTSSLQNTNLAYRFKNLKSSNLSYLPNEKNVRLVDNIFLKKSNFNFLTEENNFENITKYNLTNSVINNYENMYFNSNLN
jgi:hypothetical protein